MVGLVVFPERLRRKLFMVQERCDQSLCPLISDGAADEAENLRPFRLIAMHGELGIERFDLEVLRFLKAADEFCRRQILHEGAVEEAVESGTTGAEEIVPLPEATDHLLGCCASRCFLEFVLAAEPAFHHILQFAFADEVTTQSGLAVLHMEGNAAQEVFLVVNVEEFEAFDMKVVIQVPFMDEHVHALLVEARTFAR